MVAWAGQAPSDGKVAIFGIRRLIIVVATAARTAIERSSCAEEVKALVLVLGQVVGTIALIAAIFLDTSQTGGALRPLPQRWPAAQSRLVVVDMELLLHLVERKLDALPPNCVAWPALDALGRPCPPHRQRWAAGPRLKTADINLDHGRI